MNVRDIEKNLKQLFDEPLSDGERRKIVFWTDIEGAFEEVYEKISLPDVKIVPLHQNNQFTVKHLLEEQDPDSSYLIYSKIDLHSHENWLYDIVQYSKTFYADRISLLMKEFNIDPSLRPVVQKYASFFNAKDRRNRLKALKTSFETKQTLELALMNVLCRKQALDFQTVLRTVLLDTIEDDKNRYLQDFERFFSINTFWAYVEQEYGYRKKNRSLKHFLKCLLVTALTKTIPDEQLQQLERYIIATNRTNIYVFVDHWMHHTEDGKIYNKYAQELEEELQIKNLLQHLPIDRFEETEVFPIIDRAIILYITDRLLEQYEQYDVYLGLIQQRRNKHFYKQYEHLYQALYYSIQMFKFYNKYSHGIPQGQAKDLLQAYVSEYYQVDSYYRKFYIAYDSKEKNDLLQKLKKLVENIYTNWYMEELNIHWSDAIRREMTTQWNLAGFEKQQRFYSDLVINHPNERIFVIISDALRYEVASELKERLDSEIHGTSTITPMLGVIPSVTKLGMAALLPHEELTINEKGEVIIDGKRTASLEDRNSILQTYEKDSIAVHYQDLFEMNKEERRKRIRGKKIVYIYHDHIDAIGDKRRTEIHTFQAVENTLDELMMLVRILRNDVSGTHIYITADHGFIYQREKVESYDLIQRENVDAIDMGRRYVLINEKMELPGQQCIDLSMILQNEQPLYTLVPNATLRYQIQGGGANFVHGGASLQEIVVPKLYIHNQRGGQTGIPTIQKVEIKLTSNTRRITNSIFNLFFFQTEAIGEKIIPRFVKVYMANEKGDVLSNEEIILGDLEDKDPKKRIFTVQFALQQKDYDRNKTYDLVIKDIEEDAIVEKIPFSIHLGLISDFEL